MSFTLNRAELKAWRQTVTVKREEIIEEKSALLALEQELTNRSAANQAREKKLAAEEARLAAAETLASGSHLRIGTFISDAFICELRKAVFKRCLRRIKDAKTEACQLSSSERETLSEFPLPAHLIRQLFQWLPLRAALHLGLTCKGLFNLYQSSLFTDRRSLVLANGYYEFKDTGSSPFISEWVDDLRTVSLTRLRLVNSYYDEASFNIEENDDVPAFNWDRLFRSGLPRLTGLTSLTLIIEHELTENMAELSTALAASPLSQLTTLKLICFLKETPVEEEEEEEEAEEKRNLAMIVPLQLPALTHLNLSLHFPNLELPTSVNAFRVLFGSPLLFSVLPQLSSLHLHSRILAGEVIRSLRDHILPLVPQLLTPTTMAANPPALQLSLVLRWGEDKTNLEELVEQLLPNEEEKGAVATSTQQALASITHLKIYAIPDWPLPRFLSALIHLKSVTLSITLSASRSSLHTADYLATLTALSSLPALEEMVLSTLHRTTTLPALSHPVPQPPVLVPLRRLELYPQGVSCAEDPAQFFHLAHCFPHLEELTLEVWMLKKDCGRCEHFHGLPDPSRRSAEEKRAAAEAIRKCFRRLFHSLGSRNPDHLQTTTGRWAEALVKCSLFLRSPEGDLDWHN